MNRHINMLPSDLDMFPEDGSVPEEKIIAGIAFSGREKAAERAEIDRPWQILGLAIGVGAMIGCLLARVCRAGFSLFEKRRHFERLHDR